MNIKEAKEQIKNVYIPDESRQYSFYDLTGDGVDELLLGQDGAFLDWLEMENGEVMFHGYGESYLCEGNVLEQYQAPDRYWDGESHTYFAFADGTAVFKDDGGLGNVIANIQRRGSQWYRYPDPNGWESTEISHVLPGHTCIASPLSTPPSEWCIFTIRNLY